MIIIGFTSSGKGRCTFMNNPKQKIMKQRGYSFLFYSIMTGILQAQTLTLKDAGQLFLEAEPVLLQPKGYGHCSVQYCRP